MEAGYHARQHVDCEGDPGPAHRLSALFVDHDDINLGMVDLDDLQWTGRGVFPGARLHGADRHSLAPASSTEALIDQQQTRLCRPPARRRPSALATGKA